MFMTKSAFPRQLLSVVRPAFSRTRSPCLSDASGRGREFRTEAARGRFSYLGTSPKTRLFRAFRSDERRPHGAIVGHGEQRPHRCCGDGERLQRNIEAPL